MITKAELADRLHKSLTGLKLINPKVVSEKLRDHLVYCHKHYDEMDADAKDEVDKVFEALKVTAGEVIQAMPESLPKRKLLREHAKVSGKHHRATDLLSILEQPPVEKLKVPFTTDARSIFLESAQQLLDFVYDIKTRGSLKSPFHVCFSLFIQCVDDLLAGMHLAQHGYCPQAYAHTRSVLECLDKIDLFVQQPQWLTLWASDDEREIINELRPSAVREKLGNPRRDPFYNFLSQLGSHASFKAFQARVAVSREPAEGGRRKLVVWVGGSPQEHHMLWVHTYILHALLSVMAKIIGVFEDRLDQAEILVACGTLAERFSKYVLDHLVPWSKKNGIPTDELEREARRWPAQFVRPE